MRKTQKNNVQKRRDWDTEHAVAWNTMGVIAWDTNEVSSRNTEEIFSTNPAGYDISECESVIHTQESMMFLKTDIVKSHKGAG